MEPLHIVEAKFVKHISILLQQHKREDREQFQTEL